VRLRELHRDRGVWGLLLIGLAMFYRPLATQTFYFRDLYLLFYPKRVLMTDALRAGRIPLWDPFTNGGQPFLTLPSNFAFHPSNVLYLVLPRLFAFNLVLVLHVMFCAVAAYWAARVMRLSAPAAIVAGVVFAFCGFTLSTANLTPLLLGLPWIPMTIGLTHRALCDGRSIVPSAFAAAMPLFGAAVELTAMLFATLAVWIFFSRYAVTPRQRAIALAIIAAGTIGLSLIVTLPATSIIAESTRNERRSFASFSAWSVAPQRLPELIVPRFFGNADSLRDEAYWGRALESGGYPYILSLYLGIPALLLAIAGATSRSESVEVPRRALTVIASIALLLSLGRHLPGFAFLYDHVPLIGMFRYPVKAQIAMLFPIAMLAACGAESLRRNVRIAAAVLALIAGALAIAIGTSAAFTASFARAFTFKPLDASLQTMLALAFAHAAIAALAFAIASARPHAVAAIVALDLFAAGFNVNFYAPREIFDEPASAAFVREATGPMRFHAEPRPSMLRASGDAIRYLAEWQLATLADYTASTFGVPVVFHTDYDGLAPLRMSHLNDQIARMPWNARRAIFDRAGVRTFMTQDELRMPNLAEIARLEAPQRPLRIYGNANAAAARFVSRIDLAPTPDDALLGIMHSTDLTRAIVEAPVVVDNCGAAPVRLLARSLNSARYEVEAPCRGLVVFAENHDPGWRARVDGRETPHVRADYAFTAVAVARGRHVIERTYFPPRLWAGAVGTLLTMVILFSIARAAARATAKR